MTRILTRFALLGLVFGVLRLQAADSYPTSVPAGDENSYSPYYYTGLIYAGGYSGSGSVAVHPRIVMGCAHVNYNTNTPPAWLPQGSIRWFWKWNEGSFPEDSQGTLLTGYFYFSDYAKNAQKYGGNKKQTFALDFVANYSSTQDLAGGDAAPWIEDGKKFLTAKGKIKKITGYPSARWIGFISPGEDYRMCETGPFTEALKVSSGNYLTLVGIQTGGGNSGGPVWGWENGRWALAAVMASGSEHPNLPMIGVYAMNPAGWGLVISALKVAEPSPKQLGAIYVSAKDLPLAVPDQKTAVLTFPVSELLGTIQTVKINLDVIHGREGDLQVTLKSPKQNAVTLKVTTPVNKSSGANLKFTEKSVSGFNGLSANGTWTLTVQDCYRNNSGRVNSASLEITTR